MTIGKLSGQCDFGQKGQSYCNQRGQSCVAKRVKVAWLFQVVVVKYFEGMHGWKNYPYVGYGHQLQRGERFTADMTERQADSLLRADLWKCFEHFKGYGKDALLLSLLAYNVGVGRLLGYGKHPKSRLLRKIEAGDRNFYREYVSFCRYKGKVLRGLVKRRQVEFVLFWIQ